jgi:hypothetical protein
VYPGSRGCQRCLSDESCTIAEVLRPAAFAGGKVARKGPLCFTHENDRAIRKENRKPVLAELGTWELYDMEKDRSETHGLAQERPELVSEFASQSDGWARRTFVEPWREKPVPERGWLQTPD